MSNDLIIANLQVLLKDAQMSNNTTDHFRVRAYQKALKAIKGCTYPLTSGKVAQQLDGVGKKIADKIQEIIDTGKLHQVDELGPDQLIKVTTITEFGKIWSVGPVKAQKLWDVGARSIEDIKNNFKYLLTNNQKVGLKYFNDLQKRSPRDHVTDIVKIIQKEIMQIRKELDWDVIFRVCGSYRRRLDSCGDIDILLCGGDILNELVNRLTLNRVIIKTLGIGPTKYLGLVKTTAGIAFRIDMEIIKKHEWPFALL